MMMMVTLLLLLMLLFNPTTTSNSILHCIQVGCPQKRGCVSKRVKRHKPSTNKLVLDSRERDQDIPTRYTRYRSQ